jgi:hypothetical protein
LGLVKLSGTISISLYGPPDLLLSNLLTFSSFTKGNKQIVTNNVWHNSKFRHSYEFLFKEGMVIADIDIYLRFLEGEN